MLHKLRIILLPNVCMCSRIASLSWEVRKTKNTNWILSENNQSIWGKCTYTSAPLSLQNPEISFLWFTNNHSQWFASNVFVVHSLAAIPPYLFINFGLLSLVRCQNDIATHERRFFFFSFVNVCYLYACVSMFIGCVQCPFWAIHTSV